MLPDPIARQHFLNKGLPMTRVHGQGHREKMYMVYSKHTDSIYKCVQPCHPVSSIIPILNLKN